MSPDDLAASADVSVDPVAGIVTYTLAGFLDAGLVASVRERQAAAMRQLRCGAHEHRTIIDISRCKIQTQDVVEAFRLLVEDQRYHARKIAVVVGNSLARMQIRRVLRREAVAYVETVAAATRWLTDGGGSAAPDRLGR